MLSFWWAMQPDDYSIGWWYMQADALCTGTALVHMPADAWSSFQWYTQTDV